MTRSCRACGCTDERACPGGCSWVEADLCSACFDSEAPGASFYKDLDTEGLLAEAARLTQLISDKETARRRDTMEFWRTYLSQRTGTYGFRRNRYRAVAAQLQRYGLDDTDLVVDVGAGQTEFDFFLRTELDWRGTYLGIDGAIDGTDLETWIPQTEASFFVCIEVLEHLRSPLRLIAHMDRLATKAVIATTPNPEAVDVLAMDDTHKTPLAKELWGWLGFEHSLHSFFGTVGDTILAVRQSGTPAGIGDLSLARNAARGAAPSSSIPASPLQETNA